jgi:hypothetical protein
VRAITELAKPASEITIKKRNLILEGGTALGLPVKIRLENPLLGEGCYIGSSSKPIMLNMTTGATSPEPPNKSIHGDPGREPVRGHDQSRQRKRIEADGARARSAGPRTRRPTGSRRYAQRAQSHKLTNPDRLAFEVAPAVGFPQTCILYPAATAFCIKNNGCERLPTLPTLMSRHGGKCRISERSLPLPFTANDKTKVVT